MGAAGVEPASEKARNEEITMRIRLGFFGLGPSEPARTAAPRYFYVFCLDGSGRWGKLFFQHQPVSIANVFFQLLERRALAEDTWYLWQAPDVPVAILPIFKTESNDLRHRKFGGGGGS